MNEQESYLNYLEAKRKNDTKTLENLVKSGFKAEPTRFKELIQTDKVIREAFYNKKIEIVTDTGNVGHVYIIGPQKQHSSQKIEDHVPYGFYPKNSNALNGLLGKGQIKNEYELGRIHENFPSHSVTLAIPEETWQHLAGWVGEKSEQFKVYSVVSKNCIEFADEFLKAGGFSDGLLDKFNPSEVKKLHQGFKPIKSFMLSCFRYDKQEQYIPEVNQSKLMMESDKSITPIHEKLCKAASLDRAKAVEKTLENHVSTFFNKTNEDLKKRIEPQSSKTMSSEMIFDFGKALKEGLGVVFESKYSKETALEKNSSHEDLTRDKEVISLFPELKKLFTSKESASKDVQGSVSKELCSLKGNSTGNSLQNSSSSFQSVVNEKFKQFSLLQKEKVDFNGKESVLQKLNSTNNSDYCVANEPLIDTYQKGTKQLGSSIQTTLSLGSQLSTLNLGLQASTLSLGMQPFNSGLTSSTTTLQSLLPNVTSSFATSSLGYSAPKLEQPKLLSVPKTFNTSLSSYYNQQSSNNPSIKLQNFKSFFGGKK